MARMKVPATNNTHEAIVEIKASPAAEARPNDGLETVRKCFSTSQATRNYIETH